MAGLCNGCGGFLDAPCSFQMKNVAVLGWSCAALTASPVTDSTVIEPMLPSSAPLGPLAVPAHKRRPQRITITVSWDLHRKLVERSDAEGRSLSNLASFVMEQAMA
jgi:YD repeat-containing protein